MRIALLLVTLGLIGCGGATSQLRDGAATARETPGALTAPTLAGGAMSVPLVERERPLLLVFWASWCEPCNREADAVERYYESERDRVDVVGVNVDEQPADAQSFIDAHHVTYPVMLDGSLAVSDRLGVSATPTFLLLDRQGHEHLRRTRLDATMTAAIDELVSAQARR